MKLNRKDIKSRNMMLLKQTFRVLYTKKNTFIHTSVYE